MERACVIDLPLLIEKGLAAPMLLFDKVVLSDYIGLVGFVRTMEDSSLMMSRHQMFELRQKPGPQPPRNAVSELTSRLASRVGIERFTEIITERRLNELLDNVEYLIEKGIFLPAPAYITPGFENLTLAKMYPLDYVQPFDASIYIDAIRLRDTSFVPYIMRDLRRVTEVPKSLELQDVLQIILRDLPIPRADIPLDEIIQFRQGGEASRKLWALRNWANKIAETAESPSQIEDEFMALYGTYVDHVRLLDRRLEATTLGLVMTVASDFANNMFHLKVGSALKGLFDWHHKHLDLEKERLDAPGNELSYVRSVEESFG